MSGHLYIVIAALVQSQMVVKRQHTAGTVESTFYMPFTESFLIPVLEIFSLVLSFSFLQELQ